MYSKELIEKLKHHRDFDVEPEQVLWKYLDFTKFLDMINFNRLCFTRLDTFEDNFEGMVPNFALKNLSEKEKEKIKKVYESRRKLRYINCWTTFDEKESYAMWKIFSRSYGIAIETTASNLLKLLPEKSVITKIKYYDFRDENSGKIEDLPVLWDDSLGEEYLAVARNFSAIKSKEYEYEKEIRIIYPKKDDKKNIYLNMDMTKLVKRVIISPYESHWFYELVEDLVHNKYGLKDVQVIKSSINSDY